MCSMKVCGAVAATTDAETACGEYVTSLAGVEAHSEHGGNRRHHVKSARQVEFVATMTIGLCWCSSRLVFSQILSEHTQLLVSVADLYVTPLISFCHWRTRLLGAFFIFLFFIPKRLDKSLAL